MTLEEILEQSPVFDSGKWAFYSANCCWWTSFPDDLGRLPPMTYKDGVGVVPNPGGHQLPCCPHCHSVLLQAPLKEFIEAAQSKPEHYGKLGLAVFVMSHERNIHQCYQKFEMYEIFLKPFKESA